MPVAENITRDPSPPVVPPNASLPERAVPLVIGVTGHRDPAPEQIPALRARFGETLDRLGKKYPASPLVVVTGMAAGCDTLAAEEAFARGIPVIAALAAPPERFELDFESAERADFRERLARCARVDIAADDPERVVGYRAVKTYLNKYSHLLVAFWDGLPAAKPGGTADVVAARLTGSHVSELDMPSAPTAPDVGPVVHIVTARLGAEAPADNGQVHYRLPTGLIARADAERAFDTALACLERYNVDLAIEAKTSTLAPSLATLRRWTADRAAALQRKTHFFLAFFFLVGGLTAYLTVTSEESWRILTIALGFVVFLIVRRFDFQNRYQDYRAVSEALRVQLAWNSVGLVRESVDIAYLKMVQSELEWIRMAVRAANLIYSIDPRYAATFPSDGHVQWVAGQAKFLHDAALADERDAKRSGRLGLVAIVLGIAIGIIPFAAASFESFARWPIFASDGSQLLAISDALAAAWHAIWPSFTTNIEGLRKFGAGAITLGCVAAALLSGYVERRNYETNAKRYSRASLLFADAKRRLDDIAGGKPGDSVAIVRELGREALIEHADWILAKRDRPLMLVQGG